METAWNLRDAFQEWQLHDETRVIAIDTAQASELEIRVPEGTEQLSRHIQIKVIFQADSQEHSNSGNPCMDRKSQTICGTLEQQQSRIAPDKDLCSRLQRVVCFELRHYFVIDADPATASRLAETCLRDSEWRLCKFVSPDGKYRID